MDTSSEIIVKLDNLLGSNLDLILKDLPWCKEIVKNKLKENKLLFDDKINQLKLFSDNQDIKSELKKKIINIENDLSSFFQGRLLSDRDDYQKIINLVFNSCPKDLGKGFFIKEDIACKILKENLPKGLMDFIGVKFLENLFDKISPLDIITISRYTESPEWQNIYKKLLSKCDSKDFEERSLSYCIFEYKKYADIIKNSGQPNKPWRISHNKVTGSIICFTVDDIDYFATPFLQFILVFFHYFFETAYAGKYYSYIAKESPNKLGKCVLDSFVNNVGKFDFFGPNIYSETLYWEKAIDLFNNIYKASDLSFFTDTISCGGFYNSNLISLNIIDQIWSLNLPNGPFVYHFQESFWKNIFQKIVKLSDNDFNDIIIKNLNMQDIDFTKHIINKI